ncbi:ABC transporter ATP-binding protein [Virgisporangium aliadipatigenens]|uniref:ABC transporter ATP-binding protein n=1 Tax=Virgisporangium aliadipatigenens TaxID=741659 RepID=A0A8J3YT38_9ACTN|nr:ABC transporter ATP-binding protein [Virgisporangium aliadipatigenens]GIJ51194.1 ABC transporter ATP-binding protein [Virgisporangium aliadipatigenens]
MLIVRDVDVSYQGAVAALRGVSLSVPAGGIVALVGNNGAGKSSLLRAVSRNLRRHRGEITGGAVTFDGEPLRDPGDCVRRGLIQVPEGRRIFGRLTVEENLRLAAHGAGKKLVPDRVYDLFPVLAERRRQPGLLLSGGEQQMLALGRALVAGPRLLMLDEPSLGLAPQVVARIVTVLREINADGVALLLVEQNAALALSLAQHAYVLELGRVSLEGPAEKLRDDPDVRRLYLGATAVAT